jgi:NAD+ kinase
MKKIGIIYHPLNKAALPLAKKVAEFLGPSGVSTWLGSAWENEKLRQQVPGTDLILTIGGDGTILRTAQAVAPRPTPITGINLGKLGFMTELNADEVMAKLPALLAGEGWIDERAMLEAELIANDEEPKSARIFYALNDVVVARGEIARIIYVTASIDDESLATYQADGVIAATATGSTGYSLAAGGPILHPQANEYLLVPILPHLSLDYALVLPSTAVVKLKISTTHQATLSVDGHISLPLSSGATITVKHSLSKIRFLRIGTKNSFYSSLEQKLRG